MNTIKHALEFPLFSPFRLWQIAMLAVAIGMTTGCSIVKVDKSQHVNNHFNSSTPTDVSATQTGTWTSDTTTDADADVQADAALEIPVIP